MARRPVLHQAICWAVAAAHVAMGTMERTRSGNITAHSRTCMPPIEPPMTQCQREMPSASASLAWVRTWSRTDTTGKVEP